jgi:AraC-like DNA-binding protein
MARPHHKPRATWTDDEVRDLRAHVRKVGARRAIPAIAKRAGVSVRTVREMLRGKTYRHVEGIITGLSREAKTRNWSKEVVRQFRAEYRRDESVTCTTIQERHGGTIQNIRKALLGHTYKEVPGAVESLRDPTRTTVRLTMLKDRAASRRIFTPEVALFIRLQYDPEKVSIEKLARAYGCASRQIDKLLHNHTYQEVPQVARPMRSARSTCAFTDEQVAQARLWAYRGTKTIAEIARHFGQHRSVTANMITGKTYAHLPAAVPVTMWSLRRKKHTPIPIQPVRLDDRIARMDHATVAGILGFGERKRAA